jgi:hypothetical protein
VPCGKAREPCHGLVEVLGAGADFGADIAAVGTGNCHAPFDDDLTPLVISALTYDAGVVARAFVVSVEVLTVHR